MRARVLIGLSVAAVAAILFTVVAVAGGTTTLPSVTPAELIAKMGAAGEQTRAISGEVSWQNRLLGDIPVPSQYDQRAAQSPLTASGSGRLWMSEDGLRFESQANGGDQIVVVSTAQKTAWVYDYATDAVKKWTVTGTAKTGTSMPNQAASLPTPSQIEALVARAAPYATVAVDGQTTVAGRAAYVLRLTPTATDTALGPIEVAVDGETFVPLRLQVFAASGGDPVLSFGFDSVSYDAIDPARFAFEPPAGATVTEKQIDAAKLHGDHGVMKEAPGTGDGAGDAGAQKETVRRALLTVDQAQRVAGFDLATAKGYDARPFRWAYVFDEAGPLTVGGTPLADLLAAGTRGGPAIVQDGSSDGQAPGGPVAVLLYGDGFGAIALAETKTTPELEKQLKQLPEMVDTATVGGHQAKVLATPLGGALIWQDGGRTLVAFGLVTRDDLLTFAATVQ